MGFTAIREKHPRVADNGLKLSTILSVCRASGDPRDSIQCREAMDLDNEIVVSER